jgi:hypothetical protein
MFVLVVYLITSYGAVTTTRESGFSSYSDCATEAVARVDRCRTSRRSPPGQAQTPRATQAGARPPGARREVARNRWTY